MPSDLARSILAGDTRAIARAATLIENRASQAEPLLRELFPDTGHAVIVGITGAPGSGKSTLVDQFVHALREEHRRVGVIAVDPTSPFSGGAILGDRIRMQRHHADPGVFIRSMATRGWLGGLARATTDMALLLDAAGCEYVLIETVGVGQDEIEIARLAEVTVVVLVPGMGDDVQAIKAGIMEIADVFVINKADLSGADRLEREVRASLALNPRGTARPPIVLTVAQEGRGIAEALAAIRTRLERSVRKDRAVEAWSVALREMLRERLLQRFSNLDITAAARDVAARRRDPYSVVDEWIARGAE
ncbi:MAG TPA: methylmalonyl Co-A mutase-associated GTPase MeaB [Bryobacteraceae bacterium]|nr:methylmalonyl Co-A mutase-associated GTPase MeaB [Bryobacteraceae bacterium]